MTKPYHDEGCGLKPALAILLRSVIHPSAVHLSDAQRPVLDFVF
jgi:hypothetical protein